MLRHQATPPPAFQVLLFSLKPLEAPMGILTSCCALNPLDPWKALFSLALLSPPPGGGVLFIRWASIHGPSARNPDQEFLLFTDFFPWNALLCALTPAPSLPPLQPWQQLAGNVDRRSFSFSS